jgi:hypothetical protein
MNYQIFIFTIFLPIVLTSSSSASEFITCDAINISNCSNETNSKYEDLQKQCIDGYHKWKKYSKNVLKIEFNPESNIEIDIKPRNGHLMKNLTVVANVKNCNLCNCSIYREYVETKFFYDFEKSRYHRNVIVN